jgi:hypothetical protein
MSVTHADTSSNLVGLEIQKNITCLLIDWWESFNYYLLTLAVYRFDKRGALIIEFSFSFHIS